MNAINRITEIWPGAESDLLASMADASAPLDGKTGLYSEAATMAMRMIHRLDDLLFSLGGLDGENPDTVLVTKARAALQTVRGEVVELIAHAAISQRA